MTDWENEPVTYLDLELAAMLEKATPIKGTVAKDLKMVFSVRLSRREVEDFSKAATAHGMNLSEFLRAAAQAAVHDNVDVTKAQTVGEIKQKARELTEAIDRLTA